MQQERFSGGWEGGLKRGQEDDFSKAEIWPPAPAKGQEIRKGFSGAGGFQLSMEMDFSWSKRIPVGAGGFH